MKTLLLLTVMLVFSTSVSGQSIQITDMSASAVTGGINVNVKTISFNGAGYLSHSHTMTGNTIDLSVCYYFNLTLPVLTFDNDFFIPVTAPGNYTVNVTVYNSSSDQVCDFVSVGGTATDNILSDDEFDSEKKPYAFYPNPTNGIVTLAGEGFEADHISVYDQLGRLVMQENNEYTVDLTTLQAGVYIVQANAGTTTFTQKIIKN